jgi:uncharacterized protein (DUF885 family)
LTFDVIDYVTREGLFWIYRGTSGRAFPEMAFPVNALEGVHPTLLALFVENHVFASLRDCEDYLSRLRKLPDAIGQGREALKAREAEGLIAPASLLKHAIDDLRSFIDSPANDNPLITTLARGLGQAGISGTDARVMLDEATDTLSTRIFPAYEAMIADAMAQAGRDLDFAGLWRSPFGDAYYDWLLRAHTTTRLTPNEVHALGLEELEALKARIRARFAEVGLKGNSIGELYAQLQAEPNSAYADTSEGRDAALADVERTIVTMTNFAKGLFDRLPKAACRVDPVPKALEASSYSRYTPPGADGARPGIFTLNLRDIVVRSRFEMPTLCYHEVMPGHHVQLALAQELRDLPAFRRTIVFNAYIEGWAKYAETVPETSGADSDPRVALGRMKGELYSTVNLVLDTGIHAKRWSRERAKAFFSEQTGVPEGFTEMIVTRSLVNPGQLTSYKIGMMKMMELKSRLVAKRGKKFRIQEFHDLVLRNGALPLSLLDGQVNAALAAGGRT